MMKKLLAIVIVMAVASVNAIAGDHSVLLPMPKSVDWQSGKMTLPKQLRWYTDVTDAAEHQALAAAIDQLVAENAAIGTAKAAKRGKAQLTLAIDTKMTGNAEAYTLIVGKKNINITATTAAGLYRGLQTLRQLCDGRTVIEQVKIADEPRYKDRGLMLDVSRHFFSKEFVKKQIREIAAVKMNRLHIHLTDDAGWRIQINRYPRLTQMTAWRKGRTWGEWNKNGGLYLQEGNREAYGGYYTQDDIRELVAYAKQHFVTLVPEVEMPGHSKETLAAYPELGCSGEAYKDTDFCPGNEEVYTFWRNVLQEVVALFPGTEIHIGGDEAGKNAWHTCPRCQAAMKEHNLADVNALQTYFAERISKIAHELGTTIVGWDDLMIGGAPKGSTVQIWGDISKAQQAVADGHDVIISAGRYLYLDKYQDAPLTQPEAIGGYLPLEDVYRFGAVLDTMQFAHPERVRGIEGCVWTEYIPTSERLESMIYPRVFAISEVGWGTRTDERNFRARANYLNQEIASKGYSPFSLDYEHGQRPEYLTPVEALSVGKPVTYNLPYGKAYPAGGDATLTDGLRGGWTYQDDRWQGFINGDRLDVTIDLLASQDIHSVAVDFLQVVGAWVLGPASFEILVSDDGKEFRSVNKQTWTINRDEPFKVQNVRWNGADKARYVRVKATLDEEGCKNGGWIFTDEIVVK